MILRIRKRQWMSRCGRWQGEQVPECLCNKRQYKVFWREDIADDTRRLIEKYDFAPARGWSTDKTSTA
jgi:hypothetical protein